MSNHHNSFYLAYPVPPPQVPPHEDAKFKAAVKQLGDQPEGFVFSELSGPVREVFDQFIQ